MAETFAFRRSGGAAGALIPVPREHTLKAQAVAGGAAVASALSALVGSAGPGRTTLAKCKVDLAREVVLLGGGGGGAAGEGASSTSVFAPPQRVEREAVFRLPLSGQGANAAPGGPLLLRVRLVAECVHVKGGGGGGVASSSSPSHSAAVLSPHTADDVTTSAPSFSSSFGSGGSPSAPSSPSFAGERRRERRPSGGGGGPSSGDWDDGGAEEAEWRPAAAPTTGSAQEQQQQQHPRRRRPLSCPSGEAAYDLCAAAAKAAAASEQQQQQQRKLASWARRPQPAAAAAHQPPTPPHATPLATSSAPLSLRVCSASGTPHASSAAPAQPGKKQQLPWPFGPGFAASSSNDRSPADGLVRELLRLAERAEGDQQQQQQWRLLLERLSAALQSERAAWARRAEDAERRADAALASKRLMAERLAQVEGQLEQLSDERVLVGALVEAKTLHAEAGLEAEALRGELRGARRRAGELEAALAQARAEAAAALVLTAPAYVG